METALLVSWIQFGILIFILIFLTIGVCMFLHKTIYPFTESINKFTRKIARETRKKHEKKEKK